MSITQQFQSKKKLSPSTTWLVYNNHFIPVVGYLSDYKMTMEENLTDFDGSHINTAKDFKDGYGYVDGKDNIFIYRSEPKKGDLLPWFTIKVTSEGNVKIVYSSHISTETQRHFKLKNVTEATPEIIIEDTKNIKEIYDKDMMDEMMSQGSEYKPTINENDDFLKMVTKKCLLASETDANSFKKYEDKSWKISNLIQGLSKETKLSAPFFLQWMGYGGWKFKLRVENDRNCANPLPYPVEYDSETNQVTLVGAEEEGSDGTRTIVVASPNKHNDQC